MSLNEPGSWTISPMLAGFVRRRPESMVLIRREGGHDGDGIRMDRTGQTSAEGCDLYDPPSDEFQGNLPRNSEGLPSG